MNQIVKVIEDRSKLEEAIKDFRVAKIIGLDVETTGLDPYQSELRTLQLSTDKVTLVIDCRKVGKDVVAYYLKPILEDKSNVKVLHNAKFDLKFIKLHLGIDVENIFDSYLGSILIEAGIQQPRGWHSLAQVLERYTKIVITKDEQLSDWSADYLSEKQLVYAAKDAQCLLPLRERMIESLKTLKLIRCAKLEFDCVLPVAYLELCGFYLDFKDWVALAEREKVAADGFAAEIHKELQPFIAQQSLFGDAFINLDSQQQVMKYFTQLGIPMPETTRKWQLEAIADQYPLVRKLIQYREAIKAYGSFGENFKEFINPVTGRVHADFKQIGAETGRFSSNSPNLQQVPNDKEHRGCFKSEEGNSLISADYSQIELRLLADFSKDKNFLAAFAKTDTDFHKTMASNAFRIPVEKVTSEDRTFAKRLSFGLVYGIGVKKFAMQCGILETEAQLLMNDYFKAIPQVKRWLDYQKFQVLQTRYARTASGRLTRYEFDDMDGQSRSSAQRNAANLPLQGTSADITKRALRLLYDSIKDKQDKVKIVNVVHDQIDLECDDTIKDEMSENLRQCMLKAAKEYTTEVALKVDVAIMKIYEK